jgi:hypothetical protein
MIQAPVSSFGAAYPYVDYARGYPRIIWGTKTAKGQTCFTGLRTKKEAERLAEEWSKLFPEYAPYFVTRTARR